MKKYFCYMSLMVVFLLCTIFLTRQREDIKTMDEDQNEIYFEYENSAKNFSVTKGEITRIIDPHSSEREEGEYAVIGGNSSWLCYIEFETEEGKKITNRFFPADTDNDYVGRTVDIAYYVRPESGVSVASTRTEYIPSIKQLRTNIILIVASLAAFAASFVLFIIKIRKSE